MAAMLVAAVSVDVQAAPDVVAEGVNMPAWVTRDNARRPLAVGERLRPSDQITTATGSRVLLRLGDGSAVKLGENASFVVAAAGPAPEAAGLFRATLQVLTGAFRFTTATLARTRIQRDVHIQLPTVTAGIRGTDLWGKAQPDREFIVLIEGRIDVRHGDVPGVTMDQPLSVFNAPTDTATPALGTVTMTELAQYAAQTEIAPGSGAARAGGKWKLVAGSFGNQNDALVLYDRLRAAGYAAAINPATTGDATIYRVRIIGLPSRADALALGKRLQIELELPKPEVSM
jgi:hypothetical protein